MKCEYFVNGEWIQETEFKELLFAGLLDQLVANEGLELPGFQPDKNYLASVQGETLAQQDEELEVKIVKKINARHNNSREVEDGQVTNKFPRRNPKDVIAAANAQIKKEMERIGLKREDVPFVLAVAVDGQLKMGKANKKVQDYIKKFQAGEWSTPESGMKDGHVYMLIPSGQGIRAYKLRSSFIGETKIASEVKTDLVKLFSADKTEFDKLAKKLQKHFYKVQFVKSSKGVEVQTISRDESGEEKVTTVITKNPTELVTEIVGTYDAQGNYIGEYKEVDGKSKMTTPGRIARVNYYDINGKGVNEKYADNGFITTDLYSEKGNFFNSSSFILETSEISKLSPEEAVELRKQMPQEDEVIKNTEASKNPKESKNKEDESEVFGKEAESVIKIIARDVFVRDGVKARVFALVEDGVVSIYRFEKYEQVPNSNIFNKSSEELTSKEREKASKNFKKRVAKEGGTIKDISQTPRAKKVVPIKNTKEAPDGPAPGEVGDFNGLAEEFPLDFDPGELPGDAVEEATGNVLSIEDLGNLGGAKPDIGEATDTPKTRTIENGEHWDKETELNWIAEKLGQKVRDGVTMFDSQEELEKYLSPEAYEYLRKVSKRPGALQGLFTKAGLYLKNNAFTGTAYHEAFHVVFNLALSKGQQLDILKEARKLFKDELSSNPTLIEIEELLADKFMEYVQSNGTITQTKKEGPKTLGQRIADFFDNLFKLISTLFNKKATISVESLFSDIQTGKFKDQISFENTDTSEFQSLRTKITSFLDVRLEKEAIDTLRQRFFEQVNELRDNDTNNLFQGLSDAEIISKVGASNILGKVISSSLNIYLQNKNGLSYPELHKQLLEELGINFTEDGSPVPSKYIKVVKAQGKVLLVPTDETAFPLLDKLMRTIRAEDGIVIKNFTSAEDAVQDLREPNEDDVSQEETTTLERWQQDVAYFDPRSTMSQRLKRKFNDFSQRVGTKDNTPIRNSFGTTVKFTGSEVFSFLSQRITDSTSIAHMRQKLEAIRGDRTFIADLIEELNNDPSLETDLFVYLASKSNLNYTTVYQNDEGHFILIKANKQRSSEVIKNFLVSNFLNQRSSLFNNHTRKGLEGQKDFQNINKEEITKKKEELTKLKIKFDAARGKDIISVLSEMSAFFRSMGLPITQKHLVNIWAPQRTDVQASVERVKKVIQETESILNKMESGENPFLVIKKEKATVTDFQTGQEVEVNSSIVGRLANALILGMETELSLAFRDSNNKSKYTVQYSNYLNKLFSKLKDPNLAKEAWAEIQSDPLLASLPIFDEIFEDKKSGDLTLGSFIGEGGLQVEMLESLARQGKSFSTEYKNMTPEELETISLALFLNNNTQNYAFYKLPIPADSTSLPIIKGRKYTNEEIVNNLVKIAKGEIKRINKLNNLGKTNPLRRLGSKASKSYVTKGTKFQVLSFLNNSKFSLAELAVDDSLLKEEISNFLNNEYLAKELEAAKANNIVTSYTENSIEFTPNIISSKLTTTEAKTDFYINYLMNQFYMNIELTTLLAGDPSFYKSTEDYQKRYKQVISPGTYLNTDAMASPVYTGMVFQDEIIPTSEENVKAIIDLISKDKNLSPKKKAALIATWKDKGTKKGGNNNTDGATYISIDRYLDILDGLNRLTKEHEEAAERIREGKETIEDIALFPPLKPFMFTKKNVNGTMVPVQIKNSEVLLTKAMAERKDANKKLKYPKLAKAYDILTNGVQTESGTKTVDFIAFESAVKVGAETLEFDADGNPVFNSIEEIDGKFELVGEPIVTELKNADWKLQQETPPHYVDEEGNHGSQIRNLTIADIDFDAIYEDGRTGRELALEYQNLIVKNIEESFAGVKDIFEKDGEFSIEKLASYLRREIEDRQLGDDYLDALEVVTDILDPTKKDTAVPLWHPALNRKAQELMYSFVQNRVIKQKINGGNMVNTTGYGISGDLNMTVDKKTGTITFEALLPWWSKKFFPQKENGEIDMSVLPEQLTKILGYRIPTEDKYSMFNIKVKGFTDPAQGGTIILPPEATTIAGLDFDIDKLFMLIPNFYLVTRDGKKVAKYIEPLKEGASKKEIVDHMFRDYRALRKFLKLYLPEGVNTNKVSLSVEQILENRRAILDYKKEIFDEKSEAKKLQLEIKSLESQIANAKKGQKEALIQQLSDKIIDLEDTGEIILEQENLNNATLSAIKDAIVETIAETNIDISEIQGKKARDNRIIEITKSILKHKNTSAAILDPGGFAEEKALGQKLRILKIADTTGKKAKIKKQGLELFKQYENGKINIIDYQDQLSKLADELDDLDFNINYPSTQRELFTRNMTGAALIGIFANHNVNHAKAQLTELRLSTPITINGKKYQDLNQIYADSREGKIRISKSLANLLAAAVDNAKDPIASYLNLNTFTADIVATMLRLGIEKETVFTFVNQPIILNLTQQFFAAKGNSSQIKESLHHLKLELRAKMLKSKKLNINADELVDIDGMSTEELNLNLGSLQNSLTVTPTKEYYINQYKVLHFFELMEPFSAELGNIVRGTKSDSSSPGPSHGAAFSTLYKQNKMLRNENPLITGVDGLLLLKEDEGAQINAAFTQYAWREFMNIVNKIFPSIGETTEGGLLKLSQLGKIKVNFSNMKDSIYSITEKEANAIDSAALSFLVSGFSFFDYNQAEDVLMNTPEELERFKLENPDSPFMPFLEQLNSKNADSRNPIRTIQFYTTGKNSVEIETFKRLWREMLISSDPQVINLAKNLVKYSYFNSGFQFGPYSFFHLIPLEFFTDRFAVNYPQLELTDSRGRTLNQHIKAGLEFFKKGNAEYIDRFKTQFVQNIGATSNMVPEIDLKNPIPPAHKTGNQYTNTDVRVSFGTTDNNKLVKSTQRNGQEYKLRRTKNVQDFIKQVEDLMDVARNNPELTFHVEASLNNENFPGYDFNQVFREINKGPSNTNNIPENVRFTVNNKGNSLDVRNFKAAKPDDKGTLILKDSMFRSLKVPQLVSDNNTIYTYPEFIRVGYGKQAKLYKKIVENLDDSADVKYVTYKEIANLGFSNTAVEYNLKDSIGESAVRKVANKTSNPTMTQDPEIITGFDFDYDPGELPGTSTEETSEEVKKNNANLSERNFEFSESQLEDAKADVTGEQPILEEPEGEGRDKYPDELLITKLNYDTYMEMAVELQKTPKISKSDFENASELEKLIALQQLRDC